MRPGPPIAAAVAALTLAGLAALWLARAPADRAPDAARPVGKFEGAAESSSAEFATVARAEPAGRAPAAAAIEEPAPEIAVAAPGTSAVAGWLRLDGSAPGEVVELGLGVREAGEVRRQQEVASAPDGRFRFESVADDWSGAVVLPEHFRLARPEEHGGDARAFPARAGQLDLVLDVVRLPMLRGRVLAADGTPVAQAYVLVSIHRPDGSISIGSLRANDDGRFARTLGASMPRELELTCRTDDGASFQRAWTTAILPEPNALGDIQLGNLIVAPSETASVLVLDPAGAPFEGASVNEVAPTGSRPVETGSDGIAEVQLAANVEGFEVRADGYSLIELPRPAPGAQLVARLVAANVLTVEVVDAQGEPWPHGRLRLKATRPAFDGGRDVPPTRESDASQGEFFESGRDREGAYALYRTDPQGRVEWPGLVVGLALELTAEDALGTPGAYASVPGLAAGEQRSLRLQLTRAPASVSGRCVDVAGNAIAGAKVRISAAKIGGTEVETDGDGAFRSPLLLAERVRLSAHAAGYADRRLEDVALPADLTLVLERGRKLEVRLRDAAGAPSGLGQLQVRDPANGKLWAASRAATSPGAPATGPQTFAGIPEVGIELVHVWHRRTTVAPIPDHVEEFVWDLPALGRLEVEVGACAIGELESGYLVLEALDGRGGVQQELLSPGEASRFRFEPWPGRYRLRRMLQRFTADADGWRTPAGDREIGEPVEVEVFVDRTAHAELEGAP